MSTDLRRILEGWDYEPGRVSARRIVGDDGRPYIQLRLDLGVLQMETTGRPDGRRPHGKASLLQYHQQRERTGAGGGCRLTAAECEELQKEAVQYYNRHLAMAAMDDADGVWRDSGHVLEILRLLCRRSGDERAAWPFLQLFPHVRLVHAQAEARRLAKRGETAAAEAELETAMEEIRAFAEAHDLPADESMDGGHHLLEELRAGLTAVDRADPRAEMEAQLRRAIEEEDFERAAAIRDRIRQMG